MVKRKAGTEILTTNLSTLDPPGSTTAHRFMRFRSRKTIIALHHYFTSVQFLDVDQSGIGTVTFAGPRQRRSEAMFQNLGLVIELT